MRSTQVMRHGRRMTETNKEMPQSMNCSFDISSPPPSSSKHRYSTSLFTNKQHQYSQASNENDKSSVQNFRRNTVRPSFNPSSQRTSFQQKDSEELEKSRQNIQNFYIFFFTLFIGLFLCVVYSFIRMMTKPV
ncbi:unnamed protein product [Rotaria magnacalcarata]|uniref:Uncharacterized protein n=2 Tax=Rotaria magnacalcarata TaxID=392030 RepID=A0A816HDN4_9BILA|nr:unnamed protein product [Rotaria magnacalcarata]CAF4675619.1 unnamed protein product [Rotaria magnacalcarata]